MPCGRLDGRGIWGRMDTCICMDVPLLSPETVTTLLIGKKKKKSLKRNYFLFKKKNKRKTARGVGIGRKEYINH